MARVPTVSAPTVRQDGSPLNIQPSPGLASVLGAALGKTGEIEQQHSDALTQRALQMATTDNKARVDEATINLSQAQDQFELDYRANHRGLGAVDNLPKAFDTLEAGRQAIADTMPNPEARDQFNSASRTATQIRLQSLSTFAASQREDYINNTHKAVVGNLQTLQVQDPSRFNAVQDQINAEMATYAQHAGWGPEQFKAEVTDARSKGVTNVVTAIGATDPHKAKDFLDEHKNEIDGDTYAALTVKLQPALDADNLALAAKAAVSAGVAVTAPGSGPSHAVQNAPPFTNPIHTSSGATAQVAAPYAERFQGFIKDLEATGYKIHSIGGAGPPRNVAGTKEPSYHNQGLAIDINADTNQVNGKHDLPANVGAIAAKWGLGWGGNWTSKKDYMHFSVAASEGGSVDVARGASVNSSTGGAPTSLQLQASREAVIANARALAARDHPGNAAWAERYESAALSELNQNVGAVKGTEAETYAAFSQAIEGAHATDEASMIASIPNGLNLFNSLPFTYQQALRNQTTHNANEMTPERQTAFAAIIGMRANNNAAFQQLPAEQMDLPWTAKKQVLEWQATDRRHAAETTARTAKMSALLSYETVKQGMVAHGLVRDTPEYNQFTGALLRDAEEWQAAHPKDKLDEKTVAGFAAPLFAQQRPMQQTYIPFLNINIGAPHPGGAVGPIAAAVPEADAALIRQAYINQFGREPEPWEVGYRYEQMRHRNAR